MPKGTFSSTVKKWAGSVREFQEAVFLTALDDTLSEANTPTTQGGSMPFDSGFLAGSLTVGKNSPPAAIKTLRSSTAFRQEILQLQIGDVAHVAWTADYAPRLNYGFWGVDSRGRTYSQQGYHWFEKAKQMWPINLRAAAVTLARVYDVK